MKNLQQAALNLHRQYQGKLETTAKMSVTSLNDLSLVYSPGVAEPRPLRLSESSK